MTDELPPDIRALIEELAVTERDAEALVDGLSEEQGRWQPAPGAWSVAECLDHLATANRVYVEAMRPAAARARERGKWRRGPAKPGILGGWFVRTLEPLENPRRGRKLKAPRKIKPRIAPPLADARAAFFAAHRDAVAFLRENADLDLAHIHFANPFVAILRWSLATGMNVIAAHERRHLLQAWRARNAAAVAVT
jgi:hypothetical protein